MMPRQIVLGGGCLALLLVSGGSEVEFVDRSLSTTTAPADSHSNGLPSVLSRSMPEFSSGSRDAATAIAVAAAPIEKSVSRSRTSSAYAPTEADFLNPERGFYHDIELMKDPHFRHIRQQGYSIARAYIRLDEYRHRPLPEDFLVKLQQQLQLVRSAGIKIIPRFIYNFPTGNGDEKNALDADLDLTLAHIHQLQPILQQNADIIATLQGGFVGAWGEWHNSSSGLDRPEAKAKIVKSLLAALPPQRTIQLRYPKDIREIYPQPLTGKEAFRGTDRSRVGFKNDCFLSNPSDAGTYSPNRLALRDYTNQISAFTPVGGETCAISPKRQRTDCLTTEIELARYHWSYLNSYFYEPAIDRWKREGCHGRISRKLGYRFQLINADFPARMRRSDRLTGNFTIQNVGYASPFNPRNLELILRHRSTGNIYRIPLLQPLSKTHDPRLWQPEAGEISVDIRASLPRNLPLGEYELLLNLPDPMPILAKRPEYSVRLANEGTWEAKTGFNSLQKTILISR